MQVNDLVYANLLPKLAKYELKGRGTSASFLNWFLENVYRLDDTTADDSICDKTYDKGIDGIYADHNAEEVHFFQSRIVQNTKTLGDVALKEFTASALQFAKPENIDAILSGNANNELKKIIERINLKTLLTKGYGVKPIFVTNQDKDQNAIEYLAITPNLTVYDRTTIVDNFIEFNANEGILGNFVFDSSYSGVLELAIDTDTRIMLLPISATELVNLCGISDGVLFSQNVRLSLGKTPVNDAITSSIADASEHKYFPLYHNGITIICENATLDQDTDKLKIENYVVVNGAQSLSTFYHNNSRLTGDLRVFVKIIALTNEVLSRKITINSNNQNAIKPRDLRSNHDLMLRLKAEFEKNKLLYNFEIKRGQKFNNTYPTISNEEAGRLLLAFDLKEPYSCHQIYKVFDDKYSDIFGRPEVTCYRVAFLSELMGRIIQKLGDIENKQVARYGLTRFLLLDIVAHVIRLFEEGRAFLNSTESIASDVERDKFLAACEELVNGLIVDFNYELEEAEGRAFDYKREFKSPELVKSWRALLIRSYEKDFRRGKIAGFGEAILTKEQA